MVCIEAHTMNMKVVAPTLPSFINDRKVEPVEVPLDFTIKEEPIEIPLDVIITEEQDSEEISGDVAFSFSIIKKSTGRRSFLFSFLMESSPVALRPVSTLETAITV